MTKQNSKQRTSGIDDDDDVVFLPTLSRLRPDNTKSPSPSPPATPPRPQTPSSPSDPEPEVTESQERQYEALGRSTFYPGGNGRPVTPNGTEISEESTKSEEDEEGGERRRAEEEEDKAKDDEWDMVEKEDCEE